MFYFLEKKEHKMRIVIHDYKFYSACSILKKIDRMYNYYQTHPLGIHFQDRLLKFYKSKELKIFQQLSTAMSIPMVRRSLVALATRTGTSAHFAF